MRETLEGTPAGMLIQDFTRIRLTEQMRSASDPVHADRIRKFQDPEVHPKPLLPHYFEETCQHCAKEVAENGFVSVPDDHHKPLEEGKCPTLCTHRCKHFRIITAREVQNNQNWLEAQILMAENVTATKYNMQRIVPFAKSCGVPVL
jgi:hypothetical protein